ncbi:unnamed protein product [Peniophora sp. CBMAI 1063]|nr:unnamed protein product [Peniophora sp. CBMAI 1063]
MSGPLVSIRLIPAEVLVEIFSWLSVLAPTNFAAEHMPGYKKLEWLVITHVCSFWRNLAINSPSLWTRVDTTMGREWVQAFLTRSKTTSITFSNFCLPTSAKDTRITIANEILPAQLERMQVLMLRQPLSGPPHPALLRPAPLLEVLTLLGDFLSLAEGEWALFQAPRLRHVQVLSCSSFPWKSFHVRNLSSLCLAQKFERLIDQHRPDPHELLEALRSTVQLKRLCLEETLPRFDDAHVQDLDLPMLQVLRIHGLVSDVVGFLTHLRPSHIELDVSCRGLNPTDESTDALLRVLATHQTAFDDKPFQAVCLTTRLSIRSPWAYVHAAREIVGHEWQPPLHYPREYFVEDTDAARRRGWELDPRFRGYCDSPLTQSFSLTLNFTRLSDGVKDVVDKATHSLLLQTAQLLVYDQVVDPARDILPPETLNRPFTYFPNVRQLRIGHNIFASFIRALNAQDMPKLEDIYFPDLTPAYWQNVMGSLAKINQFVSDRDKMGRRVRSLYLKDKGAHVKAWGNVGKGGTRIPPRLAHIVKELA